ncbi:hypothetical protein SPHINGO8AM_180135 [Sphingomonas sp. 8AM]|nr:hypothetical protein SPHINGO8AM_180135 [Sphingomonas sp. 8AM]
MSNQPPRMLAGVEFCTVAQEQAAAKTTRADRSPTRRADVRSTGSTLLLMGCSLWA